MSVALLALVALLGLPIALALAAMVISLQRPLRHDEYLPFEGDARI